MEENERRKAMSRCYMDATKELRAAHHHEFHALLREKYEASGLAIRERLTPQMKLERSIAEAKALLQEHGIDLTD